MGQIIELEVNKLKFWEANYRFGKTNGQESTETFLSQTRNFQALVNSIKEHGFQSNNLLTVSKDQTDTNKYVVYDGNRRLAAVKKIPNINSLYVYEENDREHLNAILSREHSSNPAAQLRWTSVQKARYDLSWFLERKKHNLLNDDERPNRGVQGLRVLETSLGNALSNSFNLTTFDRLYSSINFKNKFGIDVSDIENISVEKEEQICTIFNDIEDGRINSRNTNTAKNIQAYLHNVLINIADDAERTNLQEDSDYDEEQEEEIPTRLFRPSVLESLESHLDNKNVINELQNAPIGRYPNLLNLATRAVLDTLDNICKKKLAAPQSLHPDSVKKYLRANHGYQTQSALSIINRLGQHAHNLKNNRTNSDIANDRDLVETLIIEISQEINRQKNNSSQI